MFKKLAVVLVAVTGLMVGSAAAASATPEQPDFHKQAIASGLSNAQAVALQDRVDQVLADIPGGRQVSPTEVRYDGLIVTFDPAYTGSPRYVRGGTVIRNDPSDIICTYGWFCIIVRGTTFSFYKCGQYWSLSDWWGNSEFQNNQTSGTVARFYDIHWNDIWDNTAYDDGYVDVTPFWYFKPC